MLQRNLRPYLLVIALVLRDQLWIVLQIERQAVASRHEISPAGTPNAVTTGAGRYPLNAK